MNINNSFRRYSKYKLLIVSIGLLVLLFSLTSFLFGDAMDGFAATLRDQAIYLGVLRILLIIIAWAYWDSIVTKVIKGEDKIAKEKRKVLHLIKNKLLLIFLSIELLIAQGLMATLIGWVI